jgi:hypothetical protein
VNFDSWRSVSKTRHTQLRQRLSDPVLGTFDLSITRFQSQQKTRVEREREREREQHNSKSQKERGTSTFFSFSSHNQWRLKQEKIEPINLKLQENHAKIDGPAKRTGCDPKTYDLSKLYNRSLQQKCSQLAL